MRKAVLLTFLSFFIQFSVMAQRRTLPVGSELIVKEITSWDPQYANRDKIVGKKAVVSTRPLLFSGEDRWSGYITVGGSEYRILDMHVQVLSGETPQKKVAPKDVQRLVAGLKELVAKSVNDFAPVKSATPKSLPSQYGPSFLSSYVLSGAEDSSTVVYFDETVNRWHLRTLINTDQYTSREIDSLVTAIGLPCGKLEPRPGNDEFTATANMVSRYYVPVNRMTTGNQYRYFTISIGASMHKGKDILIEVRLLNRSFEPTLLGEQMPAPPAEAKPKKDLRKMSKDILVLAEEYKTDFKNIRTGEKTIKQYLGICYKANCKMEGSDPGDGTVCQDTTTRIWSLNIPISADKYTSQDVDQALLETNFSFGKLVKDAPIEGSDSRSYIPKDRDKLAAPYKNITFTVLSYLLNGKEISVGLLISRTNN